MSCFIFARTYFIVLLLYNCLGGLVYALCQKEAKFCSISICFLVEIIIILTSWILIMPIPNVKIFNQTDDFRKNQLRLFQSDLKVSGAR